MKELYHVYDLKERLIKMHTKLLYKRMNDSGTIGNITWIRIQKIQNKQWAKNSILKINDTEVNEKARKIKRGLTEIRTVS